MRNRAVIIVDNGLASGSTMRAAIAALRQQPLARIVVAVPVGAAETRALLSTEADEVVCVRTPEPFYTVGQWYEDFSETADNEIGDSARTDGTAKNLCCILNTRNYVEQQVQERPISMRTRPDGPTGRFGGRRQDPHPKRHRLLLEEKCSGKGNDGLLSFTGGEL